MPFDIAHLRYVEYENSTGGLKSLAAQLATYFDHFDRDSKRPDNHFLELAKLTNYPYPDFSKAEEPSLEMQAIMGLIESPELVNMIIRQQSGEKIGDDEFLKMIVSNPKVAQPFIQGMINSGEIAFENKSPKKISGKKTPK